MNKILTLFILFAAPVISAQTFSGPESVEYDAAAQRWIVGNNTAGTVVKYHPQTSTVTPFASGLPSGPHGIEVLNGVVYVCDGARVKGYDAVTGTMVFNANLGATFLNGITSDGSAWLFVTDFTAKNIYRLNPADSSFNVMVTTLKTPNGIYYDGANNRCVFVTWGSAAPVQAMSLADSTISTLMNTSLSNCDGITRDLNGNWYVTAWGNQSLMQFDPFFAGMPIPVMTGLSSPADIDINTTGDSIGIPNSGNNTVVFYVVPGAVGISAADPVNVNVFASGQSIFVNAEVLSGTVEIFTIDGKLIRSTPLNGAMEISGLNSAVYLVQVKNEKGHAVFDRKVTVTGK